MSGPPNIMAILVGRIKAEGRARPAYGPKVAAIAASIDACRADGIGYEGLRYPIEVRHLGQGSYRLVSGLHRLEAAKSLGYERIECVILDIDEIIAQRMELEENLVRADLTALDRALFVKRFRELFEAEHGEVRAGRPPEDNTVTVTAFSEEVKSRLGLGEETLKRCWRVANGLHPDAIDALRNTDWLANSAPDWTDNQKALLELSAVLVEKQAGVVALLRDYPSLTMREAIAKAHGAVPPASGDEEERWMRRHCTIFGADKRLRRKFFAEAAISDFELMREAMEEAGFTVLARGPEA